MKNILFIANYNLTDKGISGGDRIFIETIREWKRKNKITILGTEEAIRVIKQYDIEGVKFISTARKRSSKHPLSISNLFLHTLNRLLVGIASIYRYRSVVRKSDIVFSVSDFYPDVLPAYLSKLINPNIKWVAAFYLFAASPWNKDNPYKTSITRRLIGFLYWFTQLFSYLLIKSRADFIVACNEIDRKKFIKTGYPANQIVAIYGGVDLSKFKTIPTPKKKHYDLVFMARLHVQKGPLIALRVIDHLVRTGHPNIRLALIGNGPEEESLRKYIENSKLENNIVLFGFLDGKEKYKILKSSKIFIHSAIYETGGMAAAEGMASGLPVVAFDHEGFDYCYPKGIVRISPIGDYKKMAITINKILKDAKWYARVQKDAIDLVQEWDWKNRAKFLLNSIKNAYSVLK